jgi:hypothetical protein
MLSCKSTHSIVLLALGDVSDVSPLKIALEVEMIERQSLWVRTGRATGCRHVCSSAVRHRIFVGTQKVFKYPHISPLVMSDKAAEIYARSQRSSTSSAEAWADLDDLAEEVDWDVEQMVSVPESSETRPQHRQR